MSNEWPPDIAGRPYPPVPPPPLPPSYPPAPPPPAPPVFGTVHPPGAPAPYPPVWDQRPKRSGMAIAALVLGIIGLVLCFLGVFSILGLVFGLISASQIKKGAGSITGLGLARAGWILGLIGLLIGAGFWVAAATGTFDEEGATDVDALAVGDCVTLDPDETVVFDLPVRVCTQPHSGEVIAIGELNPDGDREYPGDAANTAEVEGVCSGTAFDSYVGAAYADSQLDIYYFYTERPRWNKDRGEYICIAYATDGETLIGSIRGSGR